MTDTPTQLPTTGLEFVEVICYLAEIRPDGADPDADPDLFTIGGTVTLSVDTDQNLLIVRQGDDPARLTRVQDLSFTIQTSTGALIDSQGRVGFKIPRSDSTGIEPLDYTLSGEVRFTWATTGKRVVFKAIPTQTDGKLNIVDTIGLGTMTAAGVSLIPQRVAALEAQSGAYPVQQVALTGNLAYTLPADAPTDQVVSVVFTQDGVGGRTVTYGGGIDGTQAPIRSTGVTIVDFYPLGGGQWRAFSDNFAGAGTPTGPTDTTPPTPGTLSSSNATATSLRLSIVGAADDGGLDPTPYRFSTDGETTWSPWQANEVYVASSLQAGTTYTCRHEVRDAAGNTSMGATITTSTLPAPAWAATFTLGAPTVNSIAATASQLATNATAYEVSYDDGATFANISPTGSTFTLSGDPGETYSQTRLRAKNAVGDVTAWLTVPAYTLAAGTVVTATYRDSERVTTTPQALAVPIGTASPTRTVIAVVGHTSQAGMDSVDLSGASCTIGGVTATVDMPFSPHTQIGATDHRIAVFRANVPTGASADVVVSGLVNTSQATYINVWTTPELLTKIDHEVSGRTPPNTLTASTAPGGFLIGYTQGGFGAGTASWTGLVADFNLENHSGGSASTNGGNKTVTAAGYQSKLTLVSYGAA